MFSPDMALSEARNIYQRNGGCIFALEPGDGTRYELFIYKQGPLIVFGQTNGRTCVLAARNGDRVDPYSFEDVCEWTAFFMADVFHQLTGWSKEQRYYDWDRKCPINLNGDPIR